MDGNNVTLSDVVDLSSNVFQMFQQLQFNFIEIVMPAPRKNEPSIAEEKKTERNAFNVLMTNSSQLNKAYVALVSRPNDKKQQLCNACATFVNSLGATFPEAQVKNGGMVHNVVLLLRDLIWFLDNSMGTFIELAGGTACFPTFIPK